MDLEKVFDALLQVGAIGAWDYKDGELFVRGVAEFEGDPDIWFIAIEGNGPILYGKGGV